MLAQRSPKGSLRDAGRRARKGLYFKTAQKLRLRTQATPTIDAQGMMVPNENFLSLVFCGITSPIMKSLT
jgi:hypothetical protein